MKPGENIERRVLRVRHAELTRADPENSPFKSKCPVCKDGVLLVRRDQKTLEVVRDDNCIFCGQRFCYVDHEIGGESPVGPPIRPMSVCLAVPAGPAYVPEESQYPFKRGEHLLFLGEIVSMPGHCVVVNRAGKVLWGYHTDNFRELTDEEL